MAEGIKHPFVAKNSISKRDLDDQFFQLIGHIGPLFRQRRPAAFGSLKPKQICK
jgi:hypothetical protein